MLFQQYGGYAESHICEYDEFYEGFDIEGYGNGNERTLEELFLKTFQGHEKAFTKPILLLCFDEDSTSEDLILETIIQTDKSEKVTLFKVSDSHDAFPFDEEVMMLKVQKEDGNVRKIRLHSEFYSLEEEQEKLIKAKEMIERKSILTDGFDVFLITHN